MNVHEGTSARIYYDGRVRASALKRLATRELRGSEFSPSFSPFPLPSLPPSHSFSLVGLTFAVILTIYAVNFVLVLLRPRAFAEITEIGELLLRHIVAICGNDYSRGVFPLAADVGNYTLHWCCVHEKNNARLARYYIGSTTDNSYGDVKKNKGEKGVKHVEGKENERREKEDRESTWACMVIIEAVFRGNGN